MLFNDLAAAVRLSNDTGERTLNNNQLQFLCRVISAIVEAMSDPDGVPPMLLVSKLSHQPTLTIKKSTTPNV